MFKKARSKTKYTIEHRKAFRKVEKELLGKNTLRGYLHDLDKIPLYFIIGNKKTSSLHRRISRHHENRAKSKSDYIQMIIDWESARYTKPDKPLNARQTMEKFYPHLQIVVEPILDELGL